MSRLFNHFLLYIPFRKYYGYLRFVYFTKIQKRLKYFKDEENEFSLENTVEYNLTALKHIQNDFSMRRMEFLIHSLLSLEFLSREARILIIGPRTENDLLILKGHGFKNVVGLDLITYSPMILLGDMHKMPFEDNSFDVVICGWTISYSKDPQVACNEIFRVCKNEGVIAFGFDHLPPQSILNDKSVNEAPLQPNRVNSIADISGMFPDRIGNVYYAYDAYLKNLSVEAIQKTSGLGASIVMFIFQAKKTK